MIAAGTKLPLALLALPWIVLAAIQTYLSKLSKTGVYLLFRWHFLPGSGEACSGRE